MQEKPGKAYMDASGFKVLQTGLWVNLSHPFLGASPDGLVLTSPDDKSCWCTRNKMLKNNEGYFSY